jgi:hypothetical protein
MVTFLRHLNGVVTRPQGGHVGNMSLKTLEGMPIERTPMDFTQTDRNLLMLGESDLVRHHVQEGKF